VLNEFKTGKSPIMVATDVASRGIDVRNITHVLNYDYPNNSEDYVHRIGRTGRAGAKGTAITFFTTESESFTWEYFCGANANNEIQTRSRLVI
jgi:ATP-dependent RNA helicase DDX5/DBP2